VAKWLSDMCGLRTWVANCKWLKGMGGQVALRRCSQTSYWFSHSLLNQDIKGTTMQDSVVTFDQMAILSEKSDYTISFFFVLLFVFVLFQSKTVADCLT